MDRISRETRRRNMAAIRAKDTRPELFVRNLLHRAGYRYRLYRKDLPGKPDLFFRKYDAAVFVHGCFWHQHKNCKYAAVPKSNVEFWHLKLKGNTDRDRHHAKALQQMGYRVLVLWECEIRAALKGRSDRILNKITLWLDRKNVKES